MEEEMVIEETDYGLIVKDSPHPEIEIYILGSYGQSGHSSLVIVLMAVDGGIAGMPPIVTNIPYGKKKDNEIPAEILKGLRKIRKKFRPDCPFLSVDGMNKIIKAWTDLNGV